MTTKNPRALDLEGMDLAHMLHPNTNLAALHRGRPLVLLRGEGVYVWDDHGRRYIEAIDAAVRALAQEPDRAAWVREWRGERASPDDIKRLNTYMDERARGGPRIE